MNGCTARGQTPGRAPEPEKSDTQYCIYDRRHNDYGYSEAWVQFLVGELRKSGTWAALEAIKL